jgi:peptidoglycan-associated lipoprotein
VGQLGWWCPFTAEAASWIQKASVALGHSRLVNPIQALAGNPHCATSHQQEHVMETAFLKALCWGLAAAAAVGLSGCASAPAQEATVTKTMLNYSTGVAPALAQVPESRVARVEVQGGPPATPLGIVYFDFDRYDVKNEYRDDLEKHASLLRAEAGTTAVIEGHTDSFGSAEYNLALGNRRAEVVRRSLTLLGVKDAQLEAISFGETTPAAPGEDAASRALNRRAEIRYGRR